MSEDPEMDAGSPDAGSPDAVPPVADVDELAGSWTVIDGTGAPAALAGPVRLTVEGDRLAVATGCNTARGRVSVEDGCLVAGPLMSTRMACEPALMEQERWILEMLESRPLLRRSGPALALSWGEDEDGDALWWLGLLQESAEQPA